MPASMRLCPFRQTATGFAVALVAAIATGVPTDLVDTPLFGRQIAVSGWAYPAWIVSSALIGLLVVAGRAGVPAAGGGLLTLVAIGCPVCNKLVLLLVGAAGAVRWFAPIQPVLAGLAVALLAAALVTRLRRPPVHAGRTVPARHERRVPWSHYSRASTHGRPPPKE